MDEEIKKRLDDHEMRISKLESLYQSRPETINKKISIKEFILSKKPNGYVQKTLTIGYYLEKYECMPSFNVKDLETAFRSAKEKVPGNMNEKVNKNIQQGYIMESKEKKNQLTAWNLTNSGEKFVENDFKGE